MNKSPEELQKFGQALHNKMSIEHPGTDWVTLRGTFGFYQYKRKHNLSEEDIEQIRIGWESL